ncbi:MAG: DUF1501 domain-containing protein, partial [Bryobacteraceae bacterium]
MTRRQLLTGAGSWATLASLVKRGDAQVEALPVTPRGSAKICIFVNMNGAPSHLDTFDPKDAGWNAADADIQQHGNGILLNRTFFPNFTRFANDMLVLRSVQSWEAEHQRGQFYLTTAHPANPAFLAESPHIGAVVALEKGGQGKLPPFISLNGNAGRGSVFLGGKYEPMSAPANQVGFTTIQHNFFGNPQQSQTRFDQRYALLNELDARMRANPFDLSMAKH